MYDDLLMLINDMSWEEAEDKLRWYLNKEFNDTLAIMAVVIYRALGDEYLEYDYLQKGLTYNYANSELYLLLGNYYERYNINQAWLCYENAQFYCEDEDDMKVILEFKNNAQLNSKWNVKKTSIVILSYNLLDITKGCIESIRKNNIESSYEIVVVDNNSTDGAQQWLQSQSDIKLICNTENAGFPKGCNQGIELADSEADIFLLNNDTILPPNALFWLRMGLYEDEKIGATGSVSNRVSNYQKIDEVYKTVEKYIEYAKTNNVPSRNPYEKKTYLVGFALLLKRKALEEIGYLDERFSPGNYEDNDIGLRLQYAGWQVVLCHNSFIYHYGNGNGKNLKVWTPVFQENARKLIEKYGFNMDLYRPIRNDIISLIGRGKYENIRVLEIGCGFGMTLSRVKYNYPNAEIYGIEIEKSIATIGANQFDIICGNVETMELPYEEGYFDYIIFSNVIENMIDPEKFLKKMKKYIKRDGEFLCSVYNLMHRSVIIPLLMGEFNYGNKGVLDKAHIRFFTLSSIIKLLNSCDMTLENIVGTSIDMDYNVSYLENDLKLYDEVKKLPYIAEKIQFDVYMYVFSAKIVT